MVIRRRSWSREEAIKPRYRPTSTSVRIAEKDLQVEVGRYLGLIASSSKWSSVADLGPAKKRSSQGIAPLPPANPFRRFERWWPESPPRCVLHRRRLPKKFPSTRSFL